MLAKYKGFVFHDPNTGKAFLIWEQNMEFRWGRGNGWFLVGVCADDEDNNEVFTLEIACKLIGETPQRDGVQVIHQNEEELDIGFIGGRALFPIIIIYFYIA